jgi:hypothetical protein
MGKALLFAPQERYIGGIGHEKSHMLLLHLVTTNSIRKVYINFADFWQVIIYRSHD